MVTNRAAMKCCPRCNAQDTTEFSKCRYCGTRYDARQASSQLKENLPYAAPTRRLLGHILDGIVGTMIVGVVWIGLCLTGGIAIAQAAISHSNEAQEQSTQHVGSVKPRTEAASIKHSSPAVTPSSKRQTIENQSRAPVTPLLMRDAVRDWLPGYDGGGVNPSLRFPVLVLTALWYVLMWLYTASFQAGPWQATPGQSLVGCKVTDVLGNRITFTRASMRYFASLLSNLLGFLGYITVFCTLRKQTLHDILSGCIVLRR